MKKLYMPVNCQSTPLSPELADSADTKSFVEQLKSAQDEIGEWHDVMKLKEKAERRFGSVHDSPLVAALENISRASFRRARLPARALAELSKRQPGLQKLSAANLRVPFAAPTVAVRGTECRHLQRLT
jgi:hypothetical protein